MRRPGNRLVAALRAFLLLVIGALAAGPCLAAPKAPPLADGGRAVVASVVDGDTVVLADGRQVRLPGLQAPKIALGRAGFTDWPLGAESKAALAALVAGRTVTLRYGGAREDRHGRVLAQLYRDDGEKDAGTWVQGEMLRLGMARLYTFPDNRALAADMREREREARAAHRGIWADPFYAVRTPEQADRDIGTFQVVAGRVADVAVVKGVAYINFGADWRTDFTVRIDKPALKLFKAANRDPTAWAGRRVEVRGWLAKRNGPMIAASHPEQIDLLDD